MSKIGGKNFLGILIRTGRAAPCFVIFEACIYDAKKYDGSYFLIE